MSSNPLSRQDIHNGVRIRRRTGDDQKVVNSAFIEVQLLNGMFSISCRRCIFEGWVGGNDSRRLRVGWSAIISFLYSCFWAHICFRLYWRSSRQVRNVGIVDPVYPSQTMFQKTQRMSWSLDARRGRVFSERTEFNDGKSSSTPRTTAFNDDNTGHFLYTFHYTMSLRSSSWMRRRSVSMVLVSNAYCKDAATQ